METSTWLRFFSACPSLDMVVGWATQVDDDRRLGMVAIAADSGQLIAHAGLERNPAVRSGRVRLGACSICFAAGGGTNSASRSR